MKILITTIASDSHTWNLVFLQLLLEEWGHHVINLGPCVPLEELIIAAHKHRPQIILVSTVNGHGYQEGHTIINAVKAHDLLQHIKLVIGGKLTINGDPYQVHEKSLLAAGYAGVFTSENAIEIFFNFMQGLTTQVKAG